MYPRLPVRTTTGHKGLFGRVLVVGGHDEMIGAPVLASTAALRTGSGLVQAAMPRAVLPFALSITPELIGLALGDKSQANLLEAAGKADVVILGPGLGQSSAAKQRVLSLIKLDQAMVIDADALNILSSQRTWPKSFKASAVLAPHPGEMTRLNKLLKRGKTPSDDAGRLDNALAAARAFGQVIVLKGDRTVVTDGTQVYVNDTGNSALSKAGSGDVLSGILGSLIGQGMKPFNAATAAVRIHGRAGEIAGKKMGLRSPLARDVIDAIHEAIAMYEGSQHV